MIYFIDDKGKNDWEKLCSYINTKFEAGCFIITRKELFDHIYSNYYRMFTSSMPSTIDNYRLMLTHAGYLSKTNFSGIYCIEKLIEKDKTSKSVREMAYGKKG